MTCEDVEILIHALVDGELDAGHARDVEVHLADCARCRAMLRSARDLRQAMGAATLGYTAPASLRARVAQIAPRVDSARSNQETRFTTSRRTLLMGVGAGAAASAIAASGVFMVVIRAGDDRRLLGDLVAAHLRSLQAEHLTDVLSSDQHTVKPWFNGRIDIAPPVPDLDAQGFTLLGGRLDYLDGRAAAAIVYRRRAHIINLFVTAAAAAASPSPRSELGFNIYRWSRQGLNFWAISDINADELQEFAQRFQAALNSA